MKNAETIYKVAFWDREDGGEIIGEQFKSKEDALSFYSSIDVVSMYAKSNSGYAHAAIWSEDCYGEIEEIAEKYAVVDSSGEMITY